MNNRAGDSIEYLVNLPQDRLEEVEKTLRSQGIYFDRRRHIVAINDAFRDHTSMAVGSQVPGMIREINRFLEREGLRPLVPDDPQEWEPRRWYRFMQFALVQFNWNGSEVDAAWWKDEGLTWNQVVLENRDLFRKGGR